MSFAVDEAIFLTKSEAIGLSASGSLPSVAEGPPVEEDIMRAWAYRLSALALGFATIFATTARASDLPKQGTFSVASKATGSYQEIPPRNPSEVGVWDETGKIVGDGLLKDMAWRCFGMPEIIDGNFKDMIAYCVGTAQDGDQVVFGTKWEKTTILAVSAQVSGYSIDGTGKYEGIVATYKAKCYFGGMGITNYTDDCDGQGSYKLP
jgi:hypothetical protein